MKRSLLAFALLAAAAGTALPCDIVPWPHKHELRAINLVSQKMDVRIRDQAATVTIDAVFHNPNGVQIEGLYFTNLPAGAQVTDLSMTVNGKEMKAELLDSRKAREIYNQIVHARRDPALLELVGHQMIKVSIFPIGANSNVQVKISYTQMLEKDGGLVKFQAPFAHNVTNDKAIESAVLNVQIESKAAIKNVYSPTHGIDVTKRDDHNAKASYEAKNYSSRKDLLLYYSTSEQDVAADLLCYREAGEDGFFAFLVSPKVVVDESKILPKDVVFVYDRSGSMSGEKMRQGQRALVFCLERLNPADRFTIVDFATETATFRPKLVEASKDNVGEAVKYVGRMRAAGSTAIDDALRHGMELLENDPRRVRMVIFMTDGLPTVGEQNLDRILAKVGQRNEAARLCRIFVFGVGLDVNTIFLDRLAEANRGAREYVQPEENIEDKVSSLYNKFSNPVLSGLAVDFGSGGPQQVYPKQMPDLFQGGQLVVFGRYTGSGATKITVRGQAGGEEKVFTFEANFPEKETTNDYLPRLWAGRKVAYLVDSIRLTGRADKEVVDEIVALGKRYGIVTPYTSFLITEENDSRFGQRMKDEGARMHKKGEDSGKGDKSTTRESQDDSRADAKRKEAPSSDANEEESRRMLETEKRRGRATSVDQIKFVGTKVFYLKKGVWVDGAFDLERMKDRIRKVVFLSEEYLKLLERYDGIQKYLAVGDKLILVWAGEVYEITPQ